MNRLSKEQEQRLTAFGNALIDQQAAKVIVPAYGTQEGFWFGGGNAVVDHDGRIVLSGRYRNPGDSRYGVDRGTRGLELAVFSSSDDGRSFEKVLSFSKQDLSRSGGKVVSIEGSALRMSGSGVELFVSTERERAYPAGYEEFQKPGTGVWAIDVLEAESVDRLRDAAPLRILDSDDPTVLHMKDPVVLDAPDGATHLFFCTHPFTWASTNSAVATRAADSVEFGAPKFNVLPRGANWDVAISRITGFTQVPRVGAFASEPPVTVVFYDGGECLRRHDSHPSAVSRPRGYSCEEIGGLAYFLDGDISSIVRLSEMQPFFSSPWGTGASRYVSVLQTGSGIQAFWEQSKPDGAQPLVTHRLTGAQVEQLLSRTSDTTVR